MDEKRTQENKTDTIKLAQELDMASVFKNLTLYDMMCAQIGSSKTFKKLLFPHACSKFLQTLDDLQTELDPPYSDGFLFIEILTRFDDTYNGYLK